MNEKAKFPFVTSIVLALGSYGFYLLGIYWQNYPYMSISKSDWGNALFAIAITIALFIPRIEQEFPGYHLNRLPNSPATNRIITIIIILFGLAGITGPFLNTIWGTGRQFYCLYWITGVYWLKFILILSNKKFSRNTT